MERVTTREVAKDAGTGTVYENGVERCRAAYMVRTFQKHHAVSGLGDDGVDLVEGEQEYVLAFDHAARLKLSTMTARALTLRLADGRREIDFYLDASGQVVPVGQLRAIALATP